MLDGLHLERAALVGVSLGGALALDFAARRPQRVERLVLLAPSGIGRQRSGFLVKAVLLQLLGDRGRRRLLSSALGVRPGQAGPHEQELGELALLIFKHFRPRLDRVPLADDATLAGLAPPTLVIAGAQDALLDSHHTARRLRQCAPDVEVRLLPDAGHYLPGQASVVLDFLTRTRPPHSIRERGQSDDAPLPAPGRREARLALPEPYYTTALGAADLGDSLELMRALPDSSVNLVLTSPPFALRVQEGLRQRRPGRLHRVVLAVTRARSSALLRARRQLRR